MHVTRRRLNEGRAMTVLVLESVSKHIEDLDWCCRGLDILIWIEIIGPTRYAHLRQARGFAYTHHMFNLFFILD